jgi:hypothetical protein
MKKRLSCLKKFYPDGCPGRFDPTGRRVFPFFNFVPRCGQGSGSFRAFAGKAGERVRKSIVVRWPEQVTFMKIVAAILRFR